MDLEKAYDREREAWAPTGGGARGAFAPPGNF